MNKDTLFMIVCQEKDATHQRLHTVCLLVCNGNHVINLLYGSFSDILSWLNKDIHPNSLQHAYNRTAWIVSYIKGCIAPFFFFCYSTEVLSVIQQFSAKTDTLLHGLYCHWSATNLLTQSHLISKRASMFVLRLAFGKCWYPLCRTNNITLRCSDSSLPVWWPG